jgi:cyclic dehypoxanthinyl futalosine synthase
MTCESALARALAGERLSRNDALGLADCHDLTALAAAAHRMRLRHNPNRVVTYVVGRNVNYTNVCWMRCKFCAFYRVPGSEDGYVLSREDIFGKVREMVASGGVELLLQGGLNPALGIEWYEDLFRALKAEFGEAGLILHALSPAEIIYIARRARLSVRQCLMRLRAAGLDSIPGGGAEILTEEVRLQIAPLKTSADAWLGCMRDAHLLGIPTTATMMYGSVETWEDRVEHLMRVRELQDETGGFTAFILWPFQPDGTELGGPRTGAHDYLRALAVSRLVLDNVPHFQASWVTQGPRIAQISLGYGADDFGSTMMEENVVSAAGCTFKVGAEEIERLIVAAGYTPQRRNTRYEAVPISGVRV